MNERIREIAREAGIKMYHSDTLALGYLDTAHRRFAELLIQECANIDYKNASDGEFSNDDSYLISKAIKQHFGLEE